MKITNDHLFQLMEILGIIGIDVEVKGIKNQTEFGFLILNTIMQNAKQAQPEIESLIKDLSGMEVDNPIKLMKAIGTLKKDKEVMNFFTEALKSLV